MNVLDLFSGIGGFSLGLERAGMRTVAFCEIEPYCRRVLARHWPSVPIYPDVRELSADRLAADGIEIDLICGGFPCQDISIAGKGAGLDGTRSGLWFEYRRLISEIRPLFVIIENVPRLRTLGADQILADLEELGYAGEPAVVGAIHAGAPHKRQRAWIVAHANGGELRKQPRRRSGPRRTETPLFGIDGPAQSVPEPQSYGRRSRRPRGSTGVDTRLQDAESSLANTGCEPAQIPAARQFSAIEIAEWNSWWAIEPDVGRVAHGVPARMDRLRGLGNAVLPQIPEMLGRAIMTLRPILHDK